MNEYFPLLHLAMDEIQSLSLYISYAYLYGAILKWDALLLDWAYFSDRDSKVISHSSIWRTVSSSDFPLNG